MIWGFSAVQDYLHQWASLLLFVTECWLSLSARTTAAARVCSNYSRLELSVNVHPWKGYVYKSKYFISYYIWLKLLWNQLKVNLGLIYEKNALAKTRLVKISSVSFSVNNVASSVNIYQFNLQYLLHPFCGQNPVIASPEELFSCD